MRYRTGLMCIALVFLVTGCTRLTSEVAREPREDATIATRIKVRLLDAPEIDAAAIIVDSDRGVVTLKGFVDTDEQRQRAARLARQVNGVESVTNELEIK